MYDICGSVKLSTVTEMYLSASNKNSTSNEQIGFGFIFLYKVTNLVVNSSWQWLSSSVALKPTDVWPFFMFVAKYSQDGDNS